MGIQVSRDSGEVSSWPDLLFLRVVPVMVFPTMAFLLSALFLSLFAGVVNDFRAAAKRMKSK